MFDARNNVGVLIQGLGLSVWPRWDDGGLNLLSGLQTSLERMALEPWYIPKPTEHQGLFQGSKVIALSFKP